MDAANPLCRWLIAAGLAASVGCVSDGTTQPLARGQMPSDPLAPLAPLAPVIPGTVMPAAPGTPVAGSPVAPKSDSPVTTTGYSAFPAVAQAADLIKDSVPRIKVVAVVGTGNLVTDQEVIEAVRQRLGELNGLVGQARAAKEKELYAAEMRKIIERELVLDDMYAKLKKNGKLGVIDEIKEYASKAADQNLRGIRKHFGATTEEEFQTILRAQGLTIPVIRRQVERQMMADEYIRSAIKEKGRTPGFAEVRAYYDAHPDEFQAPDRVKWQDIFISFNKHATTRDAYDHALAVQKQAAAGSDFVALVKQYDNGLAVGQNGFGVGEKRGDIRPAEVEPTVWALKAGEVSTLIETPAGYHIVKVVERDYGGVRPFDAKVQLEVREKLVKEFREAEYHRLIEDLWRKGGVRVIEAPR